MKIAIYTAPEGVTHEIEMIAGMLQAGADHLYLRRTGADTHYWMAFLEQIPAAFYPNIFTTDFRVLHEMGLGGFHFQRERLMAMDERDLRENLSMLRANGIASSRTVGSLEELQVSDGLFDVLLLAPMFESISKPGHRNEWDFEALKSYLETRKKTSQIMALGGIGPEKIDMLHLLGVDGCALLGALWNTHENALETFKIIQEKCRK